MDILFAASELAPMVKVGGLADVVSALSKALRLLGNKVTIAIPRYPALEASGLLLARRLTPMVLPNLPGAPAGERLEFTVLDGKLGSGVELLVIDFPGLFDRPGVYGEPGEDYPDNARRFGLFCRAVVEVVRQRARAGTPYDVVHAILPVDDVLARDTARRLALEEGIFVGISAGATAAAALEVARTADDGAVILTMLPDTGERYLSTFLFEGVNEGSDDDWLDSLG